MTLTINAALRRRALFYAMDAKERTGETIHYGILHFLESPFAQRRSGTTGSEVVPVPPGARTRGEREPLDCALDEAALARLSAVARSLGLAVESVIDLAVERTCPPFSEAGNPEWVAGPDAS